MSSNEMSMEHLSMFVGLEITGYGVSDDDFPFLLASDKKTGHGYRIEISRDPEGNGAGFLFFERLS